MSNSIFALADTFTNGLQNEEANIVATITFSGKTVHDLAELRADYSKDDLLGYFADGSLQKWLEQHYYEEQAQSVSYIETDDIDCYVKLCTALGISYAE